jgi:predicted phage terminase large subunit-like protein
LTGNGKMTDGDQRRYLDLRTRRDFKIFVRRTFKTIAPGQTYFSNWHIAAMVWHLEQCANGAIKRLLITLPPRGLKSILASVAFPAFVLGHDPTQRIICASYSADLAGKHAHDCRTIIGSDWYRRIFPRTVISREKAAEMNFVTTRQGYRYATSVGGTLTGRGGNILIIDDALKPDDAFSEARRSAANQWFGSTLYSRLDNKRDGVIIIIMQRLHLDDLAGHVLRQEKWEHLNLPAIAEQDEDITIGPNQTHFRGVGQLLHPEREPKEVLDQLRMSLGSSIFSAQYQQQPVPLEGAIVKWRWFRQYEELPERAPGDEVIQSWDTAYKADQLSDYSVCTTWLVRGNLYFLVDIWRGRLLYPELKQKVMDQAFLYGPDTIIVENKGSGIALLDDLRQANGRQLPPLIAFDPEKDKITRMATQAAKIEAGWVILPQTARWLDDFQAEVLQFPHGRHDDQVDSLSQFLGWVGKRSEFFSWDLGGDRIGPRSSLRPAPPLSAQPNVLIRDPKTGMLRPI